MDRSGTQLLIPRSAVAFVKDTAEVRRVEAGDTRRPVAVTILMSDASHFAVALNGALQQGDRILAGRQ
jgi:hypothetical protein